MSGARFTALWAAFAGFLVFLVVGVGRVEIPVPGTDLAVVADFEAAYAHLSWRPALVAAAFVIIVAVTWRRTKQNRSA